MLRLWLLRDRFLLLLLLRLTESTKETMGLFISLIVRWSVHQKERLQDKGVSSGDDWFRTWILSIATLVLVLVKAGTSEMHLLRVVLEACQLINVPPTYLPRCSYLNFLFECPRLKHLAFLAPVAVVIAPVGSTHAV